MNSKLPHNAGDAAVIFATVYLVGFVALWYLAAVTMRLGTAVAATIWTMIPIFWERP